MNSKSVQQQVPFRVLGLDIKFPFNPYGIQKAMMNKLVLTLTNKEHSLIESPTGTGKTLVLLCSALAWRKRSVDDKHPFLSPTYKEKLRLERIEYLKKRPCTCGRRITEGQNDLKKEKCEKNSEGCEKKYENQEQFVKQNGSNSKRMKLSHEGDVTIIDDRKANNVAQHVNHDIEVITLDDSFELDNSLKENTQIYGGDYIADHNKFDINNVKHEEDLLEDKYNSSEISKSIQKSNSSSNPSSNSTKPCKSCLAIKAEEDFSDIFQDDEEGFVEKENKIPRIFYGTRTHKQISQVIRELNKTIYCKKLKMCVLSSRDRTCINDNVRDLPTRNDKCKELVSNSRKKNPKAANNSEKLDTCTFHNQLKSNEKVFESLDEIYEDRAWDIEDVERYGRQVSCCPYFGLREQSRLAEVIFCPYNYLIDPAVRKVMDINLKNSVIILDEAHNIEDTCRESASFIISTKHIGDITNRINSLLRQLISGTKKHDALVYFRDLLARIGHELWTAEYSTGYNNESKFEKQTNHYTSSQKIDILLRLQLREGDDLEKLNQHKKVITGAEDDEDKEKNQPAIEDSYILENYQGQLISNLANTLTFMYTNKKKYYDDFELVFTKQLEPKPQFNKYNSNQNQNNQDTYIYEFCLLCMNSAVSFEKIRKDAWSVIVASGTLSPIESLKTELGVNFHYTFEGAHVIQRERIFASVVSTGPKNVELNCAWKNTSSLQVQDELGIVVRDVCRTVPNGILCFFPSYDRMEVFYKRWNYMNLIQDIKTKCGKSIYRETKDLSAENFELTLDKYRREAKNKGAMLMAVFRGKVSEGIDFSDEDARAVITIGIPYPSFKEINVTLKKEYNNKSRLQGSNLLNGNDWYAAQAFRALNQALGRCIRHKEDWGAILMLDSRLEGRPTQSVSRWIRQNMIRPTSYSDLKRGLEQFVNNMTGKISSSINITNDD